MAETAPAGGKERPIIIVRKKKGGHGGHHGGAWKVAYADFVTAMMAFFLVMWLLTQADLKLRSQVAQYFRDPGILSGGAFASNDSNKATKTRDPDTLAKDLTIVQGKVADERRTGPLDADEGQAGLKGKGPEAEMAQAEEEALEKQAKAVQEEIAKAAAEDPTMAALKDQVMVQVTDAGLSIQVVDKGRQMLFDISSAELKAPLVAMLKRIAGVLGNMKNPVHVGGHTDGRPYANDRTMSNWDLAFMRANNARKILEANGLRPKQVSRVISYADSQPLVPDNPMADENRRLSILSERQQPVPASFSSMDVLSPDLKH